MPMLAQRLLLSTYALLNASNANVPVLRKRMRASVYEVTSLCVCPFEYDRVCLFPADDSF